MARLSSTTLQWVVQHFSRFRDTDIFPRAFEYDAIAHCEADVVPFLTKQEIGQYSTKAYRRCLVPKNRFGFRLATQLDPVDMLMFLGLVLEVGEDLEKSRLPVSEEIAFSSRFSPDATDFTLFGKQSGYANFDRRSHELAAEYPVVVLADIADFYPRIYLHRIETALDKPLKARPGYAKAIAQLVKGWNQNVSYGIPVGNNASRLIAEIVIDDVDRSLHAEGFAFCRYVDDYRIFCKSWQSAYSSLTTLAERLYHAHGLTLQQQKTRILESDVFVDQLLETDERRVLKGLIGDFDAILEAAGIENAYGDIEFDNLPPEQQEAVNGLNLQALLKAQLKSPEIDFPMTKFLLRRLGQLGEVGPLSTLMTEADKLYPIFGELTEYLGQIRKQIPSSDRKKVSKWLLNQFNDSIVGHLEFHRMLILTLFASSTDWGNADKLAPLYAIPQSWVRRELILAIAHSQQDYWIRAKKSEMEQMSPWERRAFLYAVSCLPFDEQRAYYKAVKSKSEPLDQWVIEWARANPINK